MLKQTLITILSGITVIGFAQNKKNAGFNFKVDGEIKNYTKP